MAAAFPNGNFTVIVNNSSSNGLSGLLVLSTTNGTNSASFKGPNNPVTFDWDSSGTGTLKWDYKDNQNKTHHFKNGSYTPGNPNYNNGSFSGGTVDHPDTSAGGSSESWDASASGPGEDEPLADPKYAAGTTSD